MKDRKAKIGQDSVATAGDLLIGKTPPQAVDVERIILGTALIDRTGLERILFIINSKSEVFYDPRHEAIYGIIWLLTERRTPVDLMTVIMEAKRLDKLTACGGDHYIINLTMGVSSSAHIDYHCRVVMEKYFSRTMQAQCASVMGELYKESADVFEQIDSVRTVIHTLEDMVNQQQESTSAKVAHKLMLDDYNSDTPPVMPCFYEDLKAEFLGGQAGDFILIGARPSMGKTAVGLNFATRAARAGIPVAMFSLEMSTVQIQKRVVADMCDVSFYRLNRKCLLPEERQRLYGYEGAAVENMPFYYDESRNLFQILSKIRILAKKGVKIILIDYIQIINTDGKKFGTREQEIAYISRTLKALALELGLVIIALAQLSKEIDKRAVKRPISSDLRESNALENDADIIILLYRPEFYGVQTWDRVWDGEADAPTAGEIELIFSKYRNGSPFEKRMKFWGDRMRLSDFNSIPETFSNPSRSYNDEGVMGVSPDVAFGNEDEDFEPF